MEGSKAVNREQALEAAMVHLAEAIMLMVESNDGPWSAWGRAETAKFIVESGVGNP